VAAERPAALAARLAGPIAEGFGLSLWDTEYVREGGVRILRVYIDRESGVSTDDCEAVSRALESELDKLDPISDSYVLEVSSAGLTRRLKKPEHFAAMCGRKVELGLYKGEPVIGKLLECTGDPVRIEKEDSQVLEIPAAGAAYVRLHFEF